MKYAVILAIIGAVSAISADGFQKKSISERDVSSSSSSSSENALGERSIADSGASIIMPRRKDVCERCFSTAHCEIHCGLGSVCEGAGTVRSGNAGVCS